jgi:hypothetical protein
LIPVTFQPVDGCQVKPSSQPMPLVFSTCSWYLPLRYRKTDVRVRAGDVEELHLAVGGVA